MKLESTLSHCPVSLWRVGLGMAVLFQIVWINPLWSADEGALVFSTARRAVVEIKMTMTEEQLKAETEALNRERGEKIAELTNILNNLRSKFGGTLPLSDEQAFLQSFEIWKAETSQKYQALMEQSTKPRHVGMGVIIDAKGYVLTCSSVVQSSTWPGKLSVDDCHGNTFSAELYAIDSDSNVALLRIPEEVCSTWVDIHTNAELRPLIGSDVYSIQSAYSLQPAPFRGMIGNYDIILGFVPFERYIQLQMDLFPGNIGAPLFSADGNFIGMLAGDFSSAEGPRLTFAIPSQVMCEVVPDLIQYRYKPRGWLGVALKQLSITGIDEGSPAQQAGLQCGDVFLEFNNAPLRTAHDLLRNIYNTKPGQHIEVVVRRQGAPHRLSLVLGSVNSILEKDTAAGSGGESSSAELEGNATLGLDGLPYQLPGEERDEESVSPLATSRVESVTFNNSDTVAKHAGQ